MKYLELKQIGYIADELGFGERTIKRYIKEAEQELERLFEELA
jgi:predicted transcriptional regulator